MSGPRRAGAMIAAMLLAGCGGEGAAPVAPPVRAVHADVTVLPVASVDAEALAARLYLVYLGRPAEPAGLAYHANAIRVAGLPAAPAALLARYRSDPQARQVLDSLAASAEARALAPDDATALLLAYRQLFNRAPDPGGAAYWSTLLASSVITRVELPLVLLASAHPLDVAQFERKLAVAMAFTAALDTPTRLAAYQGSAAGAAVREVLAEVDAATDPNGTQRLVDAALARLASVPVFSQVEAIVQTRCLGCHSVTPTMPGFATAPRGIRFDSADQIRADARRIYVNVVQTEFMPYGNRTAMTPAERALVRTWFELGQP
ncbi:DUF4214 domain-containing protein [Massilia aurea]|uniref:DUF4214 domain-containing protein n=1 Tax=Massilia aurea TaxID=373040 RepID=UPI003461F75F